jgi:galactofuranose transport system permease protein
MIDAPKIGGRGLPLAASAFFRRYAALAALVALLVFNFAVTTHFASRQTLNVNLS